MFQVVELYGAFEPWWFLDDWKDDIVEHSTFDTFEEALAVFHQRWLYLKKASPYLKSKKSLLAAFWDEKNQSWCEDCEESLQVFQSLALLKDWKEVPESYYRDRYEQRNDPQKPLSACQLKKIG